VELPLLWAASLRVFSETINLVLKPLAILGILVEGHLAAVSFWLIFSTWLWTPPFWLEGLLV